MERPKLRDLEISRASTPEGNALVLRDPLQISGKVLLLPEGLGLLLTLLDGENTIARVQRECLQWLNQRVEEQDIRQFLKKLDDALFLENKRYWDARDRAVASFAKLRSRPAALAGKAYDADPERLRQTVGEFFDGLSASAAKDGRNSQGETEGREILGVLVPHIDLERGAASYARGYKAIDDRTEADLFVVLGISHQPTRNLYVPLDMSYETPLGTVEGDREFMARLQEKHPIEAADDILAHRVEHSIEFQAVFLQYIFEGQRDFRIAPILCSYLPHFLAEGQTPADSAAVVDFTQALRETAQESGKKVCFIGGVDFAHIGRKFGHAMSAREYGHDRVEEEDRALIETILAGNSERFYAEATKEGGARNICGLPAIYTLLKVVEPSGGELLHYGQADEPETESVVTFASVALW